MLRTTRLTLIVTALAVSPALVSAQDLARNSPIERATGPGGELSVQRDQLFLENQVRDEALRKELAAPTAELQRLKLTSDLARAQAERALAEKRAAIDQARLEVDEIAARAALGTARLQAAAETELTALRAARERAELEAGLAQARYLQQNNNFRTQEIAWNARLAELQAKISEREKEATVEAYVEQRPVYLKDPVAANGDLIISDRRISLNGVISMETADFICARIDFFNNKNREFPIFLVIDDSPGGSVMAGYKILKTMQSSTAPVYVVVKSFAASMAAAICTLAPRSFAYPNAIILHHQISDGSRGNLAKQRESVQRLGEWWRRLAGPIAEKMGVTMEDFSRGMYEHSASGDWQEFADRAVELKWVDAVISSCRETAMIRNPDTAQSGNWSVATAGATGAHGEETKPRPASALPRLNPIDCYYLYNPDGYYRAE